MGQGVVGKMVTAGIVIEEIALAQQFSRPYVGLNGQIHDNDLKVQREHPNWYGIIY